jgi:predicted dehydrogenase
MMQRRRFLHSGLAAGLATTIRPLRAGDPAGRRFRTALIGAGWWGGNVLAEAVASGACEIVGLCDVDARALTATRRRLGPLTSDAPRDYRDYRELLARERPEIVIVTTPDHWHALPTIAAVQAGAHVYVEKPTAHTIGESRAMVRAARAHGRVVQVGTHRRASPHLQAARDLLRGGLLGPVGMVRCHLNLGGGAPEEPLPTVPVPPELDWDLWCGPAPLRPYNGGNPLRPDEGPGNRGIHPRGFRQYLDYANGHLGDIGVHWFDQVLWILGEKGPRRVFSTGGRPIRGAPVLTAERQTSDAPDHQVAQYAFEGFTMTWESRVFGGNAAERGDPAAANFHGPKGTLHLGYRGGWTFYPADGGPPQTQPARLNEPDGQNIRELWADFLDAIRTGRRPLSDIEEGHRASVCSLLGMISLRLGRSVAWDPDREEFPGDPEASRLLRRAYRAGWTYPE